MCCRAQGGLPDALKAYRAGLVIFGVWQRPNRQRGLATRLSVNRKKIGDVL